MLSQLQRHPRLFGLAAALSLALILVHAALGTPPGSSFKHNIPWFTGFSDAFWSGVLYPRILPDLWFGTGGFDFYFYGPLPFWVASVFGPILCPGCAPNTSFAVSGALMYILSGVSFFVFARRFFEPRWAMFGAVVFVFLPYHYFGDWYARQAVGEVAAYMFLPLLALASVQLIEDRKGGLLFAVSFVGIGLSHLPTALLSAHLIAILAVWSAYGRVPDWTGRAIMVGRFALWGGLGAALSAFYWVPALALLSDVSPDNLYAPYFEATNWLFFDGRPEPAAKTALASKWQLALVIASALAALFVLKPRRENRSLRDWILVPSLLAAFMMSILSYLIWEFWIINRIQFPLRFLLLADLSIGLTAALLAKQILQNGFSSLGRWGDLSVKAVGVAMLMAVLTALLQAQNSATQTNIVPDLLDHTGPPEYLSQAGFSANMQRLESTVTAETTDAERYARFFQEMRRGSDLAQDAFQTAAPGATISPIAGRGFVIELNLQQAADVTLPVAAWPYWQAETIDGQRVDVSTNMDLGMAKISAPAGESRLYLTATKTWPEFWGQRISVFALMAILLGAAMRSLKATLAPGREAPLNA